MTVKQAKNTDVVDVTAKDDQPQRRRPLGDDLRGGSQPDRQRRRAQAGGARARQPREPVQRAAPRPAGRAARAQLQEHIQRLTTVADVGVGSPRIIQTGVLPTSRSGNPIETILLGVLFGAAARRRPGARSRAVRPQAAPDRAGHRSVRRSRADDRAAQPGLEAPQAVRGPAAGGGRGVPNASDEPALRSRRAGPERAGHVCAQPRGQDDRFLEPRSGRRVGRAVGGAGRGRPAPAQPGRALRPRAGARARRGAPGRGVDLRGDADDPAVSRAAPTPSATPDRCT